MNSKKKVIGTSLVFTKSYDPVSLFIRMTLPKTLFSISDFSHVLIQVDYEDGESVYYSSELFKGVVKCNYSEAFLDKKSIGKPFTIRRKVYVAYFNKELDLEKGIEWIEKQLGKPYDIQGAIGVALGPNRNWQEDDKWFCYELAAAYLKACGLKFCTTGNIFNGQMLLPIAEDVTIFKKDLL